MLIVTLLLVVGLLVGAWAATARRLRLSGVVVVSLLTVYTLLSFTTLPVFLLSAGLAYLGIQFVQDRWLLYGRRLLLTAVLLGAIVPVGVFLGLQVTAGGSVVVADVEYLGSILPGIAAYNYYRQDADRRRVDLAASVALFVGLTALGVAALWLWATPPCTTCAVLGVAPGAYVTPLLGVAGSDVAAYVGVPVTPAEPVLGTIGAVTVVVVAGLALTELVRARWGFRPVGVVAVPLLALFALRTWWTLPAYVGVVAVTYLVVTALHARTLLYGRALLSVAAGISTLVMLPVAVAAGIGTGITVFFTGMLAGIGAYNFHVTAPAERVDAAVVNAGAFTLVFALARALIAPLPGGLAGTVTFGHVLAGALVLAVCAWALVPREHERPSTAAILDASPFGTEVTER